MHKLDRNCTSAPTCLNQYQYPTHNWDAVSGVHKQEIRENLIKIQGERCAYCEIAIYGESHIEHFRRKNRLHFPHLTVVWSNLFLSCESPTNCGHYKDRPGSSYNANNLIKPDEQDPDNYFYFHSSGEVRPRSNINDEAIFNAKETIKVFNLNQSTLQASRRRALEAYKRRVSAILQELMDWDEELRQEYILEEINETNQDPHCTVIRHFLSRF